MAAFLDEASFPTDADHPDVAMTARPHDLLLVADIDGSDRIGARRHLGATWRYTVRRTNNSVVDVDVVGRPGVAPLTIGVACAVLVDTDHPLHRLPA